MKWPWVSRREHEAKLAKAKGAADMFSEQCSQLAVTLHRERLRLQKAEAHVAYMQERIQRVPGLPIWPADEEKKTA